MAHPPSLRQLRAFRVIMTAGGMTAAARILNLTQPALSKQIALLEDTLGLQLFVRRRGGPMVPTKEGIAFYKSVEGTLFGLDAIPDIARDILRTGRTQLRIAGTAPLMNSKPFLTGLATFRAKKPDVQISLAARPRIDLEEWLRSRQADISLGLLPSRHTDLTSIELAKRSAVAVLSPGHALAQRPYLEESDLDGTTLILPSRQPLRDRIDQACPGLNCDIETSSSLACVGLALTQNGVAICDPFSPTMHPEDMLRVLPFKPDIPVSYGAILPRGAQSDPAIATLLSALKTSFASK